MQNSLGFSEINVLTKLLEKHRILKVIYEQLIIKLLDFEHAPVSMVSSDVV